MPQPLRRTAASLALACGLTGSAWAGAVTSRSLELQGIRFAVQSSGAGSQQQLTITTHGARCLITPIRRTLEGRMIDAEVADLNADGQPELYVFVQGAGSGSHGELDAYALNNGRSLTPITLPELTGSLAEGYQGHDSFAVVERCLARRFPIYRPGDSNSKPTGGLRQICYRLRAGEAGWILRPENMLTL
jgi:hypothetical protein